MSAANIASDVNQLLPPAVEAVILFVLITRGLWRELPSFAAYAALHVAKLPALFVLNQFFHQYLKT